MSDAARIVEELKRALEDRASEFELALIVASVINPDSVPRALEIQFSELVAPLVRGPAVSGSTCLEFFLALGFGQDLPAAHDRELRRVASGKPERSSKLPLGRELPSC